MSKLRLSIGLCLLLGLVGSAGLFKDNASAVMGL
jgi:hypothetical protein